MTTSDKVEELGRRIFFDSIHVGGDKEVVTAMRFIVEHDFPWDAGRDGSHAGNAAFMNMEEWGELVRRHERVWGCSNYKDPGGFLYNLNEALQPVLRYLSRTTSTAPAESESPKS